LKINLAMILLKKIIEETEERFPCLAERDDYYATPVSRLRDGSFVSNGNPNSERYQRNQYVRIIRSSNARGRK
jgi:hypothetical protein